MEREKRDGKISRKRFLKICGSTIAGGAIVGVSGKLIYDMRNREKSGNVNQLVAGETVTSPYKIISTIKTSGAITASDISQEQIVVAVGQNIQVYDRSGSLKHQFAVNDPVRDLIVDGDLIYLLFPTKVTAYHAEGTQVKSWEACDDGSDYCSFALADNFLFVTDAAQKCIFKYSADGNFVSVINSPNKFIIPSYSFGITYANGLLYCSNPGHHQVETYTTDGEYKGSFGKAGGKEGLFCGCCNPVYLAHTSEGEIITSEKGNPRISCYSAKGEFRSVLLDSKMLGGGKVAYDVHVDHDKLIVGGGDQIVVYQYDEMTAQDTKCSLCGIDCSLRRNVNIG